MEKSASLATERCEQSTLGATHGGFAFAGMFRHQDPPMAYLSPAGDIPLPMSGIFQTASCQQLLRLNSLTFC